MSQTNKGLNLSPIAGTVWSVYFHSDGHLAELFSFMETSSSSSQEVVGHGNVRIYLHYMSNFVNALCLRYVWENIGQRETLPHVGPKRNYGKNARGLPSRKSESEECCSARIVFSVVAHSLLHLRTVSSLWNMFVVKRVFWWHLGLRHRHHAVNCTEWSH